MTRKLSTTITVLLRPHDPSLETKIFEFKGRSHRIVIGRQTSHKTAPTASNGYFDSKVLSRNHAELWCEKSKVYIRDIKSSNGTYINGFRLSNECEESLPKEIINNDEIEFGVNISDDNGSIVYHKVACALYIFHIPLSEIDNEIIHKLSNSNKQQDNCVSISPSSPLLEDDDDGKESTQKLESLLLKLQNEIDKSRQVENNLKTIKETADDLQEFLNNKKSEKANELEITKLTQAQNKIATYEKKWKYQQQAIYTAKIELKRLSSLQLEKEKLYKELLQQQYKSKQLEDQLLCLTSKESWLLNAIEIKTTLQLLFLLTIISVIFLYTLYIHTSHFK